MSTFKDLLTAANTIEENNLHQNEKIPEVVAAFKKCYDLDPSNEETKRKYLYYFKRQFELEHIKKNQEELKVLGNAQIQQDRYEEAVIIYNASIDLDPSIESAAPIYSNRSLAFFNLGRFQEAEDDGCMAIFLKPEFARGYLRRGNAAMKLEKWKESFETYDKYFELDPENAKSDPELVKNKNLTKREVVQKEAEKRRHDKIIEKKRSEIMAIKNETERINKATCLVSDMARNPRSFDVDLAKMLVECGADLAPYIVPHRPVGETFGPASIFIVLLSHRRFVSSSILREFDELLFFVIDEMLRRDVPFVGWELSLACNEGLAGTAIPRLIRVLLETNKFDVNRDFLEDRPAPLVALVIGILESLEMPPDAADCLHLLLNWKGIDVNAVSGVSTKADAVVEMTALGVVRHPEVARILIRYGANVNAVFSHATESTNSLGHVFDRPWNPYLEELVRVLIHCGARLAPSGRDGKSSATMLRIITGAVNPETKKKTFVSEEVLQMMLQLNQQQGFLFGWQNPTNSVEVPFLLVAIREGATFRFVELLCAMTPSPMKVTGIVATGAVMTVCDALAHCLKYKTSSFEESMQVLGLLLEHGLDLFEPYSHDDAYTTFILIWNLCLQEKYDLKLLKNTIIEKRGQTEFERCMKSFK